MKFKDNLLKNTMFMICFPVVFIVVGALLLFAEGMNTQVFAYIFGGGLIIGGAINLIRYFADKAYLDYMSNGFTSGVLAIILGIIAVIKVNIIADSLTVFLGVAIMLTAIMKLQNFIQLITMKNRMWIPILAVAVVFIVAASLILINPFEDIERWKKFTYIMLFIDGIVGLAVNIFMYFTLGSYKKKAEEPVPPIPPVEKK